MSWIHVKNSPQETFGQVGWFENINKKNKQKNLGKWSDKSVYDIQSGPVRCFFRLPVSSYAYGFVHVLHFSKLKGSWLVR